MKDAWISTTYGIRNLVRWIPVIWRDRDWDQSFLLDLLEHKFRSMSEFHAKFGHHAGAGQTIKQLRLCALLCRRMSAEDYSWDNPFTGTHELRKGKMIDRPGAMYAQDLALLSLTMRKYLRHWWD